MYSSYIGGVNPFSNQSGILVFGEDSVKRAKFTLTISDVLEAHYVSDYYQLLYIATKYS